MGTSTFVQSLALQLCSILILTSAHKCSLRSTDELRFAPLMLTIYFQVDLFQTFLYLKEDSFSISFWQVIAVQEVASIAKNSGYVIITTNIIDTPHQLNPLPPSSSFLSFSQPTRARIVAVRRAQDVPVLGPLHGQDAQEQGDDRHLE